MRRTAARPLLIIAVILAGWGVAGCTRDQRRLTIESVAVASHAMAAAPSAELRIAAPAGMHDRITAASALLPPADRPSLVPAGEQAELVLHLAAPGSRADSRLRSWIVVTDVARLDRLTVRTADIERTAAAGQLYAGAEYLELIRGLLPETRAAQPIASGEIAATLANSREALAIVPLDTLTARLQALALDDIDPVRGDGDRYPLVTRGRVEAVAGDDHHQSVAVALQAALQRLDPAPVQITFTGDIIPSRCVYDRMRAVGDWTAPFHRVAARLAAAELTIGSLDAAVSGRSTPIGCRETFSLLAPPQVVAGFQMAGFDLMTLATNHAKDCGADGYCGDGPLLDTIANLRSAGIEPFGAGADLSAARQPAMVTAGGTRFAFLGYDDIAPHYHAGRSTAGTAGLDLDTLAADVRAARALADVVIVLPHWGEEYTANPTLRQQQAARIAIEAGATLVVGNHPHVVQAAGPLGAGYAAFALGNFVFDQDWSVETTEGVVMETAWLGTRLVAVRFLPVRIEGRLQPVFLGDAEGLPILRRMINAAARITGLPTVPASGSR